MADRIKVFKQRPHILPATPNHFVIDTIIYNDISENNLDLVKSRIKINTHTPINTKDISDGLSRAMGTTIFNEITFSSFLENDRLRLILDGFEKAPLRIKGSLHYDNVRSIGLLLNITQRNLLGKASRSLISFDIAEQPRFRIQNQKNFGLRKNWWFRSDVFGQQLNRRIYINGERADDFRYRYFQFDNMVNRNINSLNSYIGAGINYDYTNVKPKVDPEVNDNVLSIRKYMYHEVDIYVQYLYNDLNKAFYPTHGTFFKAKVERSFLSHANVMYSQDSLTDESGNTNKFVKLNLDYDQRLRFSPKITGIVSASAGFTFVDAIKSDELSFLDLGYGAKYYVGGNIIRPRKDDYPFAGIPDGELAVTQFMMVNLGIQFSPITNIFLTPHFNLGSIGYSNFDDYIKDAFSPSGQWSEEVETSDILSAGLTASYKSILGPVDLDVSWVNDTNNVRVFFGIGYQFNRSQ